ncbi:hypothetical protein BZA77DRAFT_328949, partial [Pyronema omphalodes]
MLNLSAALPFVTKSAPAPPKVSTPAPPPSKAPLPPPPSNENHPTASAMPSLPPPPRSKSPLPPPPSAPPRSISPRPPVGNTVTLTTAAPPRPGYDNDDPNPKSHMAGSIKYHWNDTPQLSRTASPSNSTATVEEWEGILEKLFSAKSALSESQRKMMLGKAKAATVSDERKVELGGIVKGIMEELELGRQLEAKEEWNKTVKKGKERIVEWVMANNGTAGWGNGVRMAVEKLI